jgi:hypothetical protein
MDAVLMIGTGVELPDLLRHVVEEACSLLQARYGAIGVLNPARTGLQEFVTHGMTDHEERATGDRPTGRGVLGVLITDPNHFVSPESRRTPTRMASRLATRR